MIYAFTSEETARAIYLIVLIVGIGVSFFFYRRRDSLSKTVQQALIWGLIFFGVITAYGFKDMFLAQIYPSTAVQTSENTITLSRARDGHFYATLEINGTDVTFVVDTGASAIVLSKTDAKQIGIDTDNLNYLGTAYTANGPVSTAYVTLNTVTLGSNTDYDLPASINGGDLDISLLGMDYINLYSEFRIQQDTLTLVR